jgi:hypothetical protein
MRDTSSFGGFTLLDQFRQLFEALITVTKRRQVAVKKPTTLQALHQSCGQSQPAGGMS